MSRRVLLAATLLALSALAPAQAATRCASFEAIEAGTQMPEKFKIKGFRFKDRAGGVVPMVRDRTAADGQVLHGLSFDPRSLVITLPESHGAGMRVRMRLLLSPGEVVRVRALNDAGQTLASELVNNENVYDVILVPPATERIASLALDGGEGQGVLGSTCSVAP
ncbi:MAG: hypothetical protein J0M20_11620 [Burkholderiales bacterium]|nr:hypothetical protein [Burkholderiales bacterium]